MTVVIGAICNAGTSIVVAADKMLTYGNLNMQVETAVKKIVAVNDRSVVLFSGGVSDGEEVIKRTKQATSTEPLPPTSVVAAFAAQNYQQLKNEKAETSILKPFLGVTYAGFGPLLAQSQGSQGIQNVLGMLMQHSLALDLLVAGFDDEGAHLFVVNNPGLLSAFDTVGYAAAGSGGMHATLRLSLGGQHTNMSLPETLHSVYEAKTAAEVAPGVGKLTDMAVLDASGVHFLSDDALCELANFSPERPVLSTEARAKLTRICEGLA
jgi:20S proteasome alpha/beta subunit